MRLPEHVAIPVLLWFGQFGCLGVELQDSDHALVRAHGLQGVAPPCW